METLDAKLEFIDEVWGFQYFTHQNFWDSSKIRKMFDITTLFLFRQATTTCRPFQQFYEFTINIWECLQKFSIILARWPAFLISFCNLGLLTLLKIYCSGPIAFKNAKDPMLIPKSRLYRQTSCKSVSFKSHFHGQSLHFLCTLPSHIYYSKVWKVQIDGNCCDS